MKKRFVEFTRSTAARNVVIALDDQDIASFFPANEDKAFGAKTVIITYRNGTYYVLDEYADVLSRINGDAQ